MRGHEHALSVQWDGSGAEWCGAGLAAGSGGLLGFAEIDGGIAGCMAALADLRQVLTLSVLPISHLMLQAKKSKVVIDGGYVSLPGSK